MKRIISALLLALVAVTCAAAQSQVDSENQCLPNGDQSGVDVVLEIPEFIQAGLIDGAMQRAGGSSA